MARHWGPPRSCGFPCGSAGRTEPLSGWAAQHRAQAEPHSSQLLTPSSVSGASLEGDLL